MTSKIVDSRNDGGIMPGCRHRKSRFHATRDPKTRSIYTFRIPATATESIPSAVFARSGQWPFLARAMFQPKRRGDPRNILSKKYPEEPFHVLSVYVRRNFMPWEWGCTDTSAKFDQTVSWATSCTFICDEMKIYYSNSLAFRIKFQIKITQ